jgi:hypothetical protein
MPGGVCRLGDQPVDTQGLPRAEWGAFFDDLSRQQEQGLVNVTIRSANQSDAPVITGLPLLGIQLNTKGSDADSITIIAGQDEDTAISHTISGPTQVNIARMPDGSVDVVQIDAPDPVQTRIHFLSAI